MSEKQQSAGKVRVSFKQALGLLVPYVRTRILEQVKSVALIIVYLIFFQTVVLGIPMAQAFVIGTGLALVILGLAFFMEGLMLGIMPLGEAIGIKLPQKSKLPVILVFAFILGMGVTFAEPAIGILKAAGYSVKPWDAPLLFLLLNKFSGYLVIAVGVGVGLAVVGGVLRFLYNWSLKPYLYVTVTLLLALTVWAYFEPNMLYLTGVAWDCGGVTTGPVTVPLVLALGIGISRVVGSGGSSLAGFGVVTLASLFPVFTVLCLGFPFLNTVPKPMDELSFFSAENRQKAVTVFVNQDDMNRYAFENASPQSQLRLFDNDAGKMLAYLSALAQDDPKCQAAFGSTEALRRWAATKGSADQRQAVFGSAEKARSAAIEYSKSTEVKIDFLDVAGRNVQAAAQAVIPLCLFLFLVLVLVLRERLQRRDEVVLGIVFGLIGMGMFNIGIELGLSRIGNQVGSMVPSSIKAIPLESQKRAIAPFDTSVVQSAISPAGEKSKFFFANNGGQVELLPFDSAAYEPATQQYTYVPTKGPLFGAERGVAGFLLILAFAFLLGYGATLAEPALNALGLTVEELSVGTFKKSLLMNAVASGVGLGMVFGLVKILWGIPLLWLLAPPYLLTLILTKLSTEEYVNIGWDSAGVTTGPVTVPLVLAMGLGVGGQMGVVEGFGILAMASVWPILVVLTVGLVVTRKRKSALKETDTEGGEGAAA